jgi:hypothetical protein
MSSHMSTYHGAVCCSNWRLCNDLTAEEYQNSIGELKQLVTVFADQKHRRSIVPGAHYLSSDFRQSLIHI